MALDRDALQRNQSLSNTSIKYPKNNRELRVEYSSVKQEARISDKTDAQIRSQPIGLIYCAPKLKKVVKVLWTLTLLAYVVVLPILVMMLFKDYTNNVDKLDKLKQKWQAHLEQETLTKDNKREKRDVPSPMMNAFEKHKGCSSSLKELEKKLNRLKSLLLIHEQR